MKEVLLAVIGELERQSLVLLSLDERISALEETGNFYHAEREDDVKRLFEFSRRAHQADVEKLRKHFAELRELLARFQG